MIESLICVCWVGYFLHLGLLKNGTLQCPIVGWTLEIGRSTQQIFGENKRLANTPLESFKRAFFRSHIFCTSRFLIFSLPGDV